MLTRSKDRKVANAVNKAGNQAAIANAFGLPSGIAFSCPGATSFCEKICYAGQIEKMYPSASRLLLRNFQQLVYAEYLEGAVGMLWLIKDMLNEFVLDCDKRRVPKAFRIHWDGDFFSKDYAYAWASACRQFPDIQFWVYTRSFTDELNVLPAITGIDNLTVYLSADPVNITLANQRANEYPGVRIATVADTFAEARETIVDNGRKVYDCPENGKRIPLISTKGSACIRCNVCVSGKGDVTFAVKKR